MALVNYDASIVIYVSYVVKILKLMQDAKSSCLEKLPLMVNQ